MEVIEVMEVMEVIEVMIFIEVMEVIEIMEVMEVMEVIEVGEVKISHRFSEEDRLRNHRALKSPFLQNEVTSSNVFHNFSAFLSLSEGI